MEKGFTLIELLAVIVILAIIALIATPIILNMIEDSRKESLVQSSKSYISGLQTKIVAENLVESFNPGLCIIDGEDVLCDDNKIEYKVSGNTPTIGYIKLVDAVTREYSLCMNGYKIENDVATKTSECNIEIPESDIEFNGTKETVQDSTYIAVVYLDPTDLSKTCTQSDIVDVTSLEIKSGCMRFYIYRDTGLTYRMILDRNTSGDVYWNSDGDTTIMKEVQERLLEDTKGWKGGPRLITADEIAKIVGADTSLQWSSSKDYSTSSSPNVETKVSWFYFDGEGTSYDTWHTQVPSSSNLSKYGWLFSYIRSCEDSGCNTGDNTKYPCPTKTSATKDYVEGYWTSTPVIGQSDNAWYVTNSGRMRIYDVNVGTHNGVRPVITLPKNIID